MSYTSSRGGLALRTVPPLALAMCALFASAPQSATAQVITTGTPTAAEQYMLELINRARTNPVAETTRLNAWGQARAINFTPMSSYTEGITSTTMLATMPSTGSPPLAFNPNLQGLAQNYGLAQLNNNLLPSHFYAYPEAMLGPRQRAWGYMADRNMVQENMKTTTRVNNGTNSPLVANASRVETDYFYLFLDAGNTTRGHRTNMLTSTYTEVGIGYASDSSYQPSGYSNTYYGLILTEDFGYRSSVPSFLTGVVYNDGFVSPNNFYDIGEGKGGVTINVYNQGTRTLRATTTTWASGGYTLPLSFGNYDVEFISGGTVVASNTASWTQAVSFKLDATFTSNAEGFIPPTPDNGDVADFSPIIPTEVEAPVVLPPVPQVPEVSTSAMMVLGLLGVWAGARRRSRSATGA